MIQELNLLCSLSYVDFGIICIWKRRQKKSELQIKKGWNETVNEKAATAGKNLETAVGG